jgi:glycosyltransferase involved in cell wall biosynthesis
MLRWFSNLVACMDTKQRIVVAVGGQNPRIPAEGARSVAEAGEALRSHVFPETLKARMFNMHDVWESDWKYRRLYKYFPQSLAIAIELFRKRKTADVLVTWNQQITMFVMLLQAVFFDRTPHVAMLYWVSKPPLRTFLPLWMGTLNRIVIWSSVQKKVLEDDIGYPREKTFFVRHFVDEKFWRPLPNVCVEENLVAAVGSEMRDYETFIEAMQGSSLKAHIATKEIRITRLGIKAQIYKPKDIEHLLPRNVTVGGLSLHELRNLYARAAIVVVPLQLTDTDNGVTVILEAMAMGKVVICSRTAGQVDVIEHGVNGFYVEPKNPKALLEIMERLVGNENLRRDVGSRARAHIEKFHTLGRFSSDVSRVVATLANGTEE